MIATREVDAVQGGVFAARTALLAESEALRVAADRLDGNLSEAVHTILGHKGKLVVTGLGKSGHVARKIASTLSSTGTPAVFLHAAEAAHGDLGVYTPGDPTVLISKSGATGELVRLVPVLRDLESPLIGILGNLASPLAHAVDVVLDARVAREADPLNLAPTCSSAVALGLGDALAVALMHARGFSDSDFARFHPGGQLGRVLRVRVADVMHTDDEVAWIQPDEGLRQVVIAMTERPLGAACVVAQPHGELLGLVTDGDLRRALRTTDDIRALRASDLMTREPTVIAPTVLLRDALETMEARSSQISVLPVVDGEGRCLGLVRLHDLHQPTLG